MKIVLFIVIAFITTSETLKREDLMGSWKIKELATSGQIVFSTDPEVQKTAIDRMVKEVMQSNGDDDLTEQDAAMLRREIMEEISGISKLNLKLKADDTYISTRRINGKKHKTEGNWQFNGPKQELSMQSEEGDDAFSCTLSGNTLTLNRPGTTLVYTRN